jgi:transcription antitermination factor NusG
MIVAEIETTKDEFKDNLLMLGMMTEMTIKMGNLRNLTKNEIFEKFVNFKNEKIVSGFENEVVNGIYKKFARKEMRGEQIREFEVEEKFYAKINQIGVMKINTKDDFEFNHRQFAEYFNEIY